MFKIINAETGKIVKRSKDRAALLALANSLTIESGDLHIVSSS